MSDCWYIPQELENQRDENRYTPNRPGNYETLSRLNFFYRRFDPEEIDDNVNAYAKTLLKEMHYKHFDVIEISPELFGNKYYHLAIKHFEEHLHEDDEVRMIVAGQGYFDVRDENDEWIRVLTKAGDCIVVPAGAYHRYTCDNTHYIRAIRLFQSNPKWMAIPRHTGEGDKTVARKEYLRKLHEPLSTVVGPARGVSNHIYSIYYPEQVDTELNKIVKLFLREKLQRSNNIALTLSSLAIMINITGTITPMTNESWCPDCVAVKQVIQESYNILCSTLGTQNVVFVECPVVQASYRNNPNYPYRTHPVLHVKSIPTVLILTPSPDIESTIAHSSHVEWSKFFEIKVYTDEPTVDQLTEWESKQN